MALHSTYNCVSGRALYVAWVPLEGEAEPATTHGLYYIYERGIMYRNAVNMKRDNKKTVWGRKSIHNFHIKRHEARFQGGDARCGQQRGATQLHYHVNPKAISYRGRFTVMYMFIYIYSETTDIVHWNSSSSNFRSSLLWTCTHLGGRTKIFHAPAS